MISSKDVVTSKAKDKQWRALFEKSIGRKKDDKFNEDKVREMFYSIDKDRSGDITVKVKYSDINNYVVTIVDIRLQEALRACRRTSVMGHLGVDDVEEWLKLTDKDGVCSKLIFTNGNGLDIPKNFILQFLHLL